MASKLLMMPEMHHMRCILRIILTRRRASQTWHVLRDAVPYRIHLYYFE